MVTATALLAAFLLRTHDEQVSRLRDLVGTALAAEARSVDFELSPGTRGVTWWMVLPDGVVRPKGDHREPIDEELLALADKALEREGALLQRGAPWEPIRIAVPKPDADYVAVAEIPSAVSPWGIAILLLVDAAIFVVFGGYVLWRRIVIPIQRLSTAARDIADGAYGTRIPVDGVSETAEVAVAFNEMSEALEIRTTALETAVSELRATNASLSRARVGLARAERLAAVGHLAAGVAHEVGNPMAAMLAYLEMVRRDPGISDEGKVHLDKVSAQGERVRVILRQLLDFSRPPRSVNEPVCIGDVARQVLDLVKAQTRYQDVEFCLSEDSGVADAVGDTSIVSQILLNLILNAADAVLEVERPRVWLDIRSKPSTGEEDDLDEATECSVSDNGPGVAEEDRERIFDPFFTTKPPGQGTGLGLANSQKLAEEMGGTLELVGSDAGVGAEFRLRLPSG
jgi:C4-dicarboxylate-specific signal transduction histidine kinase